MKAALRLISDNSSSDWGPKGSNGHSPRAGNGHAIKRTILVVEDEVMIRLATSDYLRESGYRVLEAADAREAQAVLQAGEPIELMFSDINMPGALDGFGLAKWVRATYPDVRIILTSGVMHTTTEGARDYGALLQKPYALETLLLQIKKAVG